MPKPIKALGGLTPTKTMTGEYEADSVLLDKWAGKVGDRRAREAMKVRSASRTLPRDRRSNTLPELLTEAWLEQSNLKFEKQVDLGFCRPDFMLYPSDTEAWVWRVQGDYWHTGEYEEREDAAQAVELLKTQVGKRRITKVINVWEKNIYASEIAFDKALAECLEKQVVPTPIQFVLAAASDAEESQDDNGTT